MAQSRLLRDILVLVLFALLGYMIFRVVQAHREIKSDAISRVVGNTGMDTQLSQAVQAMEDDLQQRRSYVYRQKKDPMDATHIIPFDFSDLFKYRELLERDKVMRLSCTIIDKNPSAIIKYQGQSHILHIGESINGKKIVEINQKSIKFSDGSILSTTKAPNIQEIMTENSSM